MNIDDGIILECQFLRARHLSEILFQLITEVIVGATSESVISARGWQVGTMSDIRAQERFDTREVGFDLWYEVVGGFQLVHVDEEKVIDVPTLSVYGVPEVPVPMPTGRTCDRRGDRQWYLGT